MKKLVLLLAAVAVMAAPSTANAITRSKAVSIGQAWANGVCEYGVPYASCYSGRWPVPAFIKQGPLPDPYAQWVVEGTFSVEEGGNIVLCDYELIEGNKGKIRHSWDSCKGPIPAEPTT